VLCGGLNSREGEDMMDRFGTFEIQAIMYAVFWFIFSLRSVWKVMKPYDEQQIEKSVDDLFSAAKRCPIPRIIPGVYSAIWILFVVFDVIGFALLFAYSGEINWVIKLLAIIVLVVTVHGFRGFMDLLPVLDDEQKFRELILKEKKFQKHSFIFILGKFARLAASIVLFFAISGWKN
jgi:hypothetical protein